MCCAKCPLGERQLLGFGTVVPWRGYLSRNEGRKFPWAASRDEHSRAHDSAFAHAVPSAQHTSVG